MTKVVLKLENDLSACIIREELVTVAKSNSAHLRRVKADYRRLLEKQKAMQQLNNEDHPLFSRMFKKLKAGMDKLEEKLQNPQCHWEKCNRTFMTVTQLHHHCETHHAQNTGNDMPAERQYKWQWEKCSRSPFTGSMTILHNTCTNTRARTATNS